MEHGSCSRHGRYYKTWLIVRPKENVVNCFILNFLVAAKIELIFLLMLRYDFLFLLVKDKCGHKFVS